MFSLVGVLSTPRFLRNMPGYFAVKLPEPHGPGWDLNPHLPGDCYLTAFRLRENLSLTKMPPNSHHPKFINVSLNFHICSMNLFGFPVKNYQNLYQGRSKSIYASLWAKIDFGLSHLRQFISIPPSSG